ncbi:hypothetical protein [Paracoccus sp. DMF]|uniref:hypothetical protein n=1 Tax=Paracoccus sp. DMF TaxID=400837 RepID=UPI0011024996|nr:hypothetical protein [Paracoccus sp. DMF]MCV2449517.1 hypothetical protein [Paracoccus sp. DMF]
MAQPVNLNDLANMPGFGAAKAALQRAGHWDEFAGSGPERAFTVEIEASSRVTATITVKARSRAEAEKKADERIESGKVDWDIDGCDLEVDNLKIRDSQEDR